MKERRDSYLMENTEEYNTMSRAHNPYGDGKAAQRIVQFFLGEVL